MSFCHSHLNSKTIDARKCSVSMGRSRTAAPLSVYWSAKLMSASRADYFLMERSGRPHAMDRDLPGTCRWIHWILGVHRACRPPLLAAAATASWRAHCLRYLDGLSIMCRQREPPSGVGFYKRRRTFLPRLPVRLFPHRRNRARFSARTTARLPAGIWQQRSLHRGAGSFRNQCLVGS